MCIIVNNPRGIRLEREAMETAFAFNGHGVGILWNQGKRRPLGHVKALMNFQEFWKLHLSLVGRPHAIHLRKRTVGPITEEFCHPFKILDFKEDGQDLYMMHNGTLRNLRKNTENRSDSAVLAEILRTKIREWNSPDALLTPQILNRLGKTIGFGNKLLFWSSNGTQRIVNSEQGWFDMGEDGRQMNLSLFDGNIDGVWYSNTYSFASKEGCILPGKPARRLGLQSETEGGEESPFLSTKEVTELERQRKNTRALALGVAMGNGSPFLTAGREGDIPAPRNLALTKRDKKRLMRKQAKRDKKSQLREVQISAVRSESAEAQAQAASGHPYVHRRRG